MFKQFFNIFKKSKSGLLDDIMAATTEQSRKLIDGLTITHGELVMCEDFCSLPMLAPVAFVPGTLTTIIRKDSDSLELITTGQEGSSTTFHTHDCIEQLLVVKGNITITAKKVLFDTNVSLMKLRDGDKHIVQPETIHKVYFDSDSVLYVTFKEIKNYEN